MLVYCQNRQELSDRGPPTGTFHAPYGLGWKLATSGGEEEDEEPSRAGRGPLRALRPDPASP